MNTEDPAVLAAKLGAKCDQDVAEATDMIANMDPVQVEGMSDTVMMLVERDDPTRRLIISELDEGQLAILMAFAVIGFQKCYQSYLEKVAFLQREDGDGN